MRQRHTACAKLSKAQGSAPPPPPAAALLRSRSESGATWLDDEHVTLLEDGAESRSASAREPRYDDTQRIWCPRP
jgi:hypothetical protein